MVDTTTYAVSLLLNLYPVNFQGLAVAPNGERIYVTRSGNGTSNGLMLVIDTTTMPQAVVAAIEMSNPTNVAVSPDGSRCYVINERQPVTTFIDEVWVIDTTTNVVLEKIFRDTTLASVAPASKGHRLYVTTGGAPAEVWVIDTTTNAVVTSFPLDGQASDLAVYARDVTVHDIYVSSSPLNKVSHIVSVAPFESGQLLSYGDAGTPGNVSSPVVVGFGGWQNFMLLFCGRNVAGEDRIYAVDQGGQLLAYGDAGTPGNVSSPVVVGFGGWQDFKFVFAGRDVASEDRIYAALA